MIRTPIRITRRITETIGSGRAPSKVKIKERICIIQSPHLLEVKIRKKVDVITKRRIGYTQKEFLKNEKS